MKVSYVVLQGCSSKIESGKTNFYDQFLASFLNRTGDFYSFQRYFWKAAHARGVLGACP